MRKIALLAAVAGVVAAGSMAKADFIYQVVRGATIASGPLAGQQLVTLQIQQTGTGTAQVGNVANYSITLSSPTQNAFTIRTWDGGGFDDTTPANNKVADFGNQGIFKNSDSSARGTPASYVRLGTDSIQNFTKYAPLAFAPAENSTTYADFQTVNTFSVDAGEGTTGYAVASFTTLAVAAVPAGTTVTFAGSAFATGLGSVPSAFSVTDPVPEPTSIALAGIGAAGLLARRRRA